MKKALLFPFIFIFIALGCSLPLASTTSTSTVPVPSDTMIPPTAPPTQIAEPATPTPEVFIALTQAVPAHVELNGVTLAVQDARFAVCDIPNCTNPPANMRYLRVTLQALDLPAGQFLDYKNLPQELAIKDITGVSTLFNRLSAYSVEEQKLTLWFLVFVGGEPYSLQWGATVEIPLTVSPSTKPVEEQLFFDGVEVSVDPLSIVIPLGLASGARGSSFPRLEGENVAPWEVTPGHIQLKLEGYLLPEKFHEPQFFVYPAQAYAEMVPGAFESIRRINNILGSNGEPISVEQIPAVPYFNAAQVFASNIQVISFQNGRGVRFLTEYAQYAAPVNNDELFYHFQGVTNDGAYYVIAILPISNPFMAETSDPGAPLPSFGVPYPDINDPNADWNIYYKSVTELLNATPAEDFTPTINQLDLLIQSMHITP